MEIAAIATEFLELGHRESLREAHLLQLIVIQDCGTHVSSILLHFFKRYIRILLFGKVQRDRVFTT